MGQAIFRKDAEHATLVVERVFDAPPAKVWAAHTASELLGEWWAPRPWKAVTQTMDFCEGGSWRYYMLGPGPDDPRSYCRVDYRHIEPGKSFSVDNYFCDEHGERDANMPNMD